MNGRPAFFEPIRQRASQRWNQLEQDPDLAGPWHQLFNQVQSPRHILSELLQNADDAGATEASVRIEGRSFIFLHNGEDFIEEHFASLCRFGYSNKRALHTIGFRGIGFKSTFSLGDTVELYTPTLSVSFHRGRFTEPKWVDRTNSEAGITQVRVAISDEHRQREVEKNLQEWLKSPVSLLFFRHIRRLRIGDQELHWGSLGPGPVPETEWMALHADPEHAFLVARSRAEPFPSDALSEIRQERLLGADQDSDFPPCKVEIVLGAKGRLYVVLPTGVETSLPFACNAPFIQDPARLKIKDPETSPTNRWLLERVGSLVSSIMLQWLAQTQESLAGRSRAYGLVTDVDRDDNSLEGICAATVEEAFEAGIKGKAFLLTNAGDLEPAGRSVIIPDELFDVWPAEQVSTLLDGANRPALSRHVSKIDREKLVHWDVIGKIDKDLVVSILHNKHLPKPKAWRGLLKLWAYVAPNVTGYRYRLDVGNIRILPVQGTDALYSASEIVRLGEKRLLQTEADWDFLAAYLLVLNQNWSRFLADQRRDAVEREDKSLQAEVDAAFAVFNAIGLETSSDVSTVIERVALAFYKKESIAISSCVRLAQIAAKLGATVGESFRFVTRDKHLRSTQHGVLFDKDGTLEGLFPESWCSEHVLYADYSKSYSSCSEEEWLRWISSGRGGLQTFAPFVQREERAFGKRNIEAELRLRGFSNLPSYPYVTSKFIVEDWNYEEILWRHWAVLAASDPNVWGRLIDRILSQPETCWSKCTNARIVQIATTGSKGVVTYAPLVSAWILKLRALPCLPDTRGFHHKPADLLRRTPETESLMDVEPFVHGRLDTETARPLLKLLGVRDMPTGPDRLLDCLRALAKTDKPPIHEVEKWYRRLDQMVDVCSTTDLANIKKTLREEKIILTDGDSWAAGAGVFLSSDEDDVPGAPVIRASVRDLVLWRKVDIAERPTAELAIQWLKGLPSGKALSQHDARRVRALLIRHPARIWNECDHWVNLAGEWVLAATLKYALTMQTLVPWAHLHEWAKQKTADLQRLPVEIIETLPFSGMAPLSSRIEERFHRSPLFPNSPERKLWLNQVGVELCRIELDDEAETSRIRVLAAELAETTWQTMPGLETVPYIDGTPAGTPRHVDVVWLDKMLYVDYLPNAKLARLVPDKLGKVFVRADVAAALNYCFGRSPEEVTDYFEENFKLAARAALAPAFVEDAPSAHDVTKSAQAASPPTPDETPMSPHAYESSEDSGTVSRDQPDEESEPSNDIEEDPQELEEIGPELQKVIVQPKPAKPSIIERFARSQGFQFDGQDRFFHADGSWIAKTSGDRFPWERRTASGEIVRYYLPKDHCLESDPLQLEADVWGLIDGFPETYALVLSNLQGDPVEVPGVRLRAMRDDGEITLYPATYRLVYDPNRE